MKLTDYKLNFINPQMQCTILDQTGQCIDSCNTLVNHKSGSVSYFQTDAVLKGAVDKLKMSKPNESASVMRVESQLSGQEKLLDYHVSRVLHDGKDAILWLLVDATKQYNWRLPKSNLKKIESAPASPEPSVMPRAGSVLIAEDDDISLLLLRSVLTGYGIRADYVRDGRTALEKYYEKKYDLLILDYRMPEMDGLEVAAKIRETDATTQIVLLTSFDVDQSQLDSVNAFLSKPIKKEELKSILIQILGEK